MSGHSEQCGTRKTSSISETLFQGGKQTLALNWGSQPPHGPSERCFIVYKWGGRGGRGSARYSAMAPPSETCPSRDQAGIDPRQPKASVHHKRSPNAPPPPLSALQPRAGPQGVVVVVAAYVRLQRRVREGRRRPVPVAHNSHLKHRLRIRYDNTKRGDAGPAHTPRATSGPRLARRINNLMQRSTRRYRYSTPRSARHPAINPQRYPLRHLVSSTESIVPSIGRRSKRHPTRRWRRKKNPIVKYLCT
ncbi:unnamed protein product, partial [Iphiclides podalirius]